MKEEVRSKILESVDSLKDELIKSVSELVQIKSVTPEFGWNLEETAGGEKKVSEYLKGLMDKEGLQTDIFEAEGFEGRASLVGVYKGAGEGKSLMFNGHIDVVPPGDVEQWGADDPFSGRVDGEYIHGRGSVDMKGGNAAAIFALKALLKAGYKPKGDVIFQNAVGEECKVTEAGTGACVERGPLADAAIVCEPTSTDAIPFEINTAQPGVFEMKWSVKGKSCHAARRGEVVRDGGLGEEAGVDAIEKGMIIYNAVKDLERKWGQTKKHNLYKPGYFCINCATIEAGVGRSLVSDNIEMSYSLFYPPQETPESIKNEIETHIKNAYQNDDWLIKNPPKIEWIFNWPSFDVAQDADICQLAQKVVKSVVPNGGELTGMFAVSDACFIAEKNVPVIILGPGDNKYCHVPGEKLSIAQLMDAARIYALIIAQWCGIE